MWAIDWSSSSSLVLSRDRLSKVGFEPQGRRRPIGQIDMPFRPDFVKLKVLILRDMELGQTGFSVPEKAHPWDSMTQCQFNFTGYYM
jgi:hypothetical protein